MAISTWSADSSVWSGNSYIWDNNTYAATATIAANSTFTSSQNVVYPVTATLAQSLSSVTGEDKDTDVTALLNLETAMTGTGLLAIPVTATITGLTGDIKNNVNFEESGTMGMTGSASSDNNFLWNDVEEDEDTLWTKISDPDN